jgi:hypothetical protein
LLTERTIITFLIWTAGLIAAPYLALTAIHGNYVPFGVVMGVALVAWIFGIFKEGMCIMPMVSLFCSGRFTFLPFKMSFAEICMLAMIGYYFIAYFALKRQFMRVGPWILAIPIIAVAVIISIDEPNFGLRIMGGGREGGSGALFMVLSAVAYVCGVSTNPPSVRLLSLTPLIALVLAFVFSIPYLASTYFPSTAPYLYLITEQVNATAYVADTLQAGGIVRESAQAQLGLTALLCLMAYYPVSIWWQPKRVWFCFLAAAAVFAVIMGGYRSELVNLFIETVLITFCYLTWRTFFFVPAFIFALTLLIAAHSSHIITLPLSAQRTLDFFPGDWDSEVVANSDDSNDFRTHIIKVYENEYASAHPWLGNGISYNGADFELYNFLEATQPTPDDYWQSKSFITAKMFHTGWISMYDSVGLVGSFFYLWGIGALTYLTGRSVFAKPINRKSPLFPVKAWLFSFTVLQFTSFFVVYGDMRGYFPMLGAIGIVWYHIDRVERIGSEKAPTRAMQFDSERAGLAVPA